MNPINRIAAMLSIPLCFMAAAAWSQTPLPTPADRSVLHLAETAQREIARDLLRATLSAEAVDADAGKVQAAINQQMAAAMARIKQSPDIAVEMAGYSVDREVSDKNGPDGKAPARWHGIQSVTLTAKDFAALLELVGTLQQQGLIVQNLAPDLSREARQSVEDALTDEALKRLQARADRVAAALGTTVLGINRITVGNVDAPPGPIRPMFMMARVAASPAPPVAEGGDAPVSVTVDADIALAPR